MHTLWLIETSHRIFVLGWPQGAGLRKPVCQREDRVQPELGSQDGCGWTEGGGAISGYVESVNGRLGWVNSADKRRPLVLSGERTRWHLIRPEGTGVAKGKSCLGSV